MQWKPFDPFETWRLLSILVVAHNLSRSQFLEQVVPSLINVYTPFAPQIRCRSHSFEWLHPSMSMLSIRATRVLIWYDWLILVDPVYLFDLLGFRGHAQVLPKYGIEATEKGTSIMAALDLRAVYQGTPNIACCAFDPVSHCCCPNWNARCSILHSADWSLKATLKDMIARPIDIDWPYRDGRFCGDPHGRVGWGWGGVGDDNVLCTCTHGRCYATSWDGVGDDNVPCTCTHGRCYATSSFLYLHTWSLLRNIMGWGGVGCGGGW